MAITHTHVHTVALWLDNSMAAVNIQAKLTGYAANFVSWIIKSMNHPVKHKKVLTQLKKSAMSFPQGTHLCIADRYRLKTGWVGQIVHSNFNSKTEGWPSLWVKTSHFLYQPFYLILWVLIMGPYYCGWPTLWTLWTTLWTDLSQHLRPQMGWWNLNCLLILVNSGYDNTQSHFSWRYKLCAL